MASQISLQELIEGLASAVIEAQDRIEWHQVSNLRRYFDKDLRPESILVRLPSLNPQAEERAEEDYRAPILGLVSTSLLKIKEVEITFDADLVEVADAQAGESPTKEGVSGAAKQGTLGASRGVRIGIGSSFVRGKAGSVHVVLKVESSEPPEGAARLINHLTQTQGPVGPPKKAQ
jgi:Protein of unknown function (DUF2589)